MDSHLTQGEGEGERFFLSVYCKRRNLRSLSCNVLGCVSPAQLNWKRCLRKRMCSSASLRMQTSINCEFISFQVNQYILVLNRRPVSSVGRVPD